MSYYDSKLHHLCVCSYTGVKVKTMPPSDNVVWRAGTITVGPHTWPTLFATGSTAEYPLLVKPSENPRWFEFENFFGFQHGEYTPDRVRGVYATSFTMR